MSKHMTKAERLAMSAQAVRSRKGEGDRSQGKAPERTPATPPTDEQRALFSAKPMPVRTERGQVVGLAYRRQPYFVTLAKLPADKAQPKGSRMITADQFRALRFYRAAWENTVASETRCALDLSVRGSNGEGITLPQAMWESARVKDCERQLAGLLGTMRAIALHDKSFADVAMERWGSRDRERIVIGKGSAKPRIVKEIVARSSEHPKIIRSEFLDALEILTVAVGRHLAVE